MCTCITGNDYSFAPWSNTQLFFFFLNAETGNKEDFQATNSRNELLIQTADITEQTTNQRTFTDPSNKVTIRRVPKQIQNFNRKIMLLVG